MTRVLAAVLGVAIVGAALGAGPAEEPLPLLGTRLSEFPAGEGKAVADKACLQCHAADMARQQKLTEKQWTAEVDKMIRWGAEVPADRKAALVAYLSAHFGPANDFAPVEVAPVSRSAPAH